MTRVMIGLVTRHMTRLSLVCTCAALIAFSAVISSQTPSGHGLFEQALAKERVDGNLPEAIKLYERVVTEFASDRALAARALLQVGQCYEKLGRSEAVPAYERVVRDFADQADVVAQARAKLTLLKRPAVVAATGSSTPQVRPLPTVEGSEMLSISPDGTKIAFMEFQTGQNLAVLDVATQQVKRLTNFDWSRDSFWVYYAAWSPDSRRIAHMQCPNNQLEKPCELRVVTLSGESTMIARSGQTDVMGPGGWFADGSAIVVIQQRTDRTATVGFVPTQGGPFVPLRTLSGWTGRYAPLPAVSPDGQLIAFVEGSPGEIHVISRDGRTAHRITDHPADDSSPIWSPDSRHLAFLSDREGVPGLWEVAIKDAQPASEPRRVKDGMQDVYPVLGWTTRGIAYSQYQRLDDIYTVPIDPTTGEFRGNPRLIPYRRTGHNVVPEWSPDGKYLAFVSSTSGAPDQPDRRLVLLPSAGGEPREFVTPAHRLWTLRWFGDSRGLGITGHDARGERLLFRLTLSTGEWQTFPLPVDAGAQWNGMYFDFNADGSRYFYSWQDAVIPSALKIVGRDLRSDRERVVYQAKPDDQLDRYRGLRFNPDRRQLSFRARGGIHIVDVETGQDRVVQDTVAGEPREPGRLADVPSWSPNGRALLTQRTTNPGTTERQTTDLRLIRTDGGEVRRIPLGAELTRLLSARGGGSTPSVESVVWSPDGSRLAISLRASRLEAFMIENPLALTGGTDVSARK